MVARAFSPINQESEASRPLLNPSSVWAMQQVSGQHSETLGPEMLLPPKAMGTYHLNSPASQEPEHDVCQPHLTSRVQESCFSTGYLSCLLRKTQGFLSGSSAAGCESWVTKRKLTRFWCCLLWPFCPLPRDLCWLWASNQLPNL